jgi:TPR repeat protein
VSAKKYTRAVEQFIAAAELGSADAMNELGVMNKDGRGMRAGSGDKEAMEWFEKAAGAGHAGAMNNIGRMHEEGAASHEARSARRSGTARRRRQATGKQ